MTPSRRSSVLMLGLLPALLSRCGGHKSKSATPDTAAVASVGETEASAT